MIPRRKNPRAPHLWQHQDARGDWCNDLRDAEATYRDDDNDERREHP